MKVDVVVNTMRMQIDPATQNRLMPALSYRAGELLRGQVMLTAGDKLQVRLDNGRLLNALPADDVLLSPGSTVMLRVTGNMDGTLVMQLLSQEQSQGQMLGGEQGVDLALLRLGITADAVSRALFTALKSMQVEPGSEMMTRAAALLQSFPELGTEGAAFLAANHIPAGRPEVDVLLELMDGYKLGDDLQALGEGLLNRLQSFRGEPQSNGAQALTTMVAELARQAEATQEPVPAVITAEQEPGQVASQQNDQNQSAITLSGPPARESAPAQAQTSSVAAEAERPPARARQATVPAAQGMMAQPAKNPTQAQSIPMGQGAAAAPEEQAVQSAAPQAVLAQAPEIAAAAVPQTGGTPDQVSPAVQLMSLVALALGEEGEAGAAPALGALAAAGQEWQAVNLLLDTLLSTPQEAAERLDALVQTLPPEQREAVRTILAQAQDHLRLLAAQPQPDVLVETAQDGLPRLIRQVAELFVAIDSGAQSADRLVQSAAQQGQRLQELVSTLQNSAVADRDTTQQMNRMAGASRLIGDINQYAYQQLPVQMNDRMRTVELYVKKSGKGRKKIDPENANILIALDTDSMGHLESHVQVSKKTVRLRFGVERGDLVQHVSSYLPDFAEAMKAIGYRLGDLRMQVIEKPVTPLTAAQAMAEEPVPQGRLDVTL